jgi:hypothetical protein
MLDRSKVGARRNVAPGPSGWELGVRFTTAPHETIQGHVKKPKDGCRVREERNSAVNEERFLEKRRKLHSVFNLYLTRKPQQCNLYNEQSCFYSLRVYTV